MTYDSSTDPVLKRLRDWYAANTPEELDAMHQELEQVINDDPIVFRTIEL